LIDQRHGSNQLRIAKTRDVIEPTVRFGRVMSQGVPDGDDNEGATTTSRIDAMSTPNFGECTHPIQKRQVDLFSFGGRVVRHSPVRRPHGSAVLELANLFSTTAHDFKRLGLTAA
jgi:hypothetical protein